MHCRSVASFSLAIATFAACAAAPDGAGIDWSAAAWMPCTNAGTKSLRGITVVDASTVWVSGAGGTILRTTDGGASWVDVAPPDAGERDFRDVEAFSVHDAVAMVAGQPAEVVRTVDGGCTWRLVVTDPRPAAFFDAIAFAGDRGVLVGDPIDGAFCVWTTNDAGRTWTPDGTERVVAAAGEAAFAASGSCAAILTTPRGLAPCLVTGGTDARFLVDDGGHVWRSVRLPMSHGAASRGAFAVAFRQDPVAVDRGVVVGGDHERRTEPDGTAACTTDGGRTWIAAATPPSGYRSGVVWIDHHTVVATGADGCSVSTDAGRTWRDFGATGFHAIAQGRDGSVFACGSDGRVARLAMPRRKPVAAD